VAGGRQAWQANVARTLARHVTHLERHTNLSPHKGAGSPPRAAAERGRGRAAAGAPPERLKSRSRSQAPRGEPHAPPGREGSWSPEPPTSMRSRWEQAQAPPESPVYSVRVLARDVKAERRERTLKTVERAARDGGAPAAGALDDLWGPRGAAEAEAEAEGADAGESLARGRERAASEAPAGGGRGAGGTGRGARQLLERVGRDALKAAAGALVLQQREALFELARGALKPALEQFVAIGIPAVQGVMQGAVAGLVRPLRPILLLLLFLLLSVPAALARPAARRAAGGDERRVTGVGGRRGRQGGRRRCRSCGGGGGAPPPPRRDCASLPQGLVGRVQHSLHHVRALRLSAPRARSGAPSVAAPPAAERGERGERGRRRRRPLCLGGSVRARRVRLQRLQAC